MQHFRRTFGLMKLRKKLTNFPLRFQTGIWVSGISCRQYIQHYLSINNILTINMVLLLSLDQHGNVYLSRFPDRDLGIRHFLQVVHTTLSIYQHGIVYLSIKVSRLGYGYQAFFADNTYTIIYLSTRH